MTCAWREITSYADVSWVPLFVILRTAIFTAGFVIFVYVVSAIARSKRRSLAEHEFDELMRAQTLRDNGLGWILTARWLLVPVAVFVFLWPSISPTCCENVKCRGYKGLKPRTECLPQNASPSPDLAQGSCHLHQRHPGAARA